MSVTPYNQAILSQAVLKIKTVQNIDSKH